MHRIGLSRLLLGERRSQFLFEWGDHRVPLPEVDVAGRRLWGMTLRVIDDLLDRIDGRGVGLARPTR